MNWKKGAEGHEHVSFAKSLNITLENTGTRTFPSLTNFDHLDEVIDIFTLDVSDKMAAVEIKK